MILLRMWIFLTEFNGTNRDRLRAIEIEIEI